MKMSWLDSIKYGRRNMGSFTREEMEQIRNTPRPDLAALKAESERIMERIRLAEEREDAAAAK